MHSEVVQKVDLTESRHIFLINTCVSTKMHDIDLLVGSSVFLSPKQPANVTSPTGLQLTPISGFGNYVDGARCITMI